MKKILLLTDFSDIARNALIYGIEMFKNHDAHFLLLNTFDLDYAGTPYSAQVKEELAKESIEGLQKEIVILKHIYPSIQIDFSSEYGALIDVINRSIKENKYNPETVVLGCRGESVVENILLGSNAFDVIKYINIPLIVVPENSKFSTPKKIAFATDLKLVDNKIVEPLKEIVKYFDAELSFINVSREKNVDDDNSEIEFLESFQDVKTTLTFISDSDVYKSILKYSFNNEVDMIALVRYNYSFIERLFKPSITKKVMMNSELPMIIFHTTP